MRPDENFSWYPSLVGPTIVGSIWKVSAVLALLGTKLSDVNASVVRRVYHPLLGNRRPAAFPGYATLMSTASVGAMLKLPIDAIFVYAPCFGLRWSRYQ